ncbi:hemerythrin domain-containing protein [uncultured Sphingomonas sp.]|uniref:hemerythrin domain-containing protein n=1 Tax=uncultured Sphingomonas sp. TaxID=158754 RepID=UPI0025FF1CAB|nr:hemerythrin domain-containing protein [uncultured Sphingomonas sp.]
MPQLSFERLISEHDQIERMITALSEQAADPDIPASAISDRLFELSLLVADHLAHEDGAIYPAILRTMGAASHATQLNQSLHILKMDWISYLSSWPLDCIEAERDKFSRHTEDMLPRLREQVQTETQLLYAAGLRHGIITLRDRNPRRR